MGTESFPKETDKVKGGIRYKTGKSAKGEDDERDTRRGFFLY